MGIEIERKFLVDKIKWEKFEKPKGENYRQGYLISDPTKTIRIRQTSKKGFLTIKGISVGASRAEFEYEIPIDDATELLNKFAESELSKIRYTVLFKEKIWEVDQFLGDNEGLVVAEIELESEEETFIIPDWIGSEVTSEKIYFNSNLTQFPFKVWA
jgi:adenylate cyclase